MFSEWWADLLALEKVFVGLAFPFTLLTIIQLVLELIGAGGDSDAHDGGMDHGGGFDASGHGADVFLDHFHFFSVRNLIYFLMMFGWTGLAFSKAGAPAWLSIPVGMIAGLLTTVIIGWVFYNFSRFTESGNIRIENAVGQIGTVYIAIPEHRSGSGVIQLVLQGMTQELDAITDGEKLPTGKPVQVVEVVSGNTVLVTGADRL